MEVAPITPFKFKAGKAHSVFDVAEAEIESLESMTKIKEHKLHLQKAASRPPWVDSANLARAITYHCCEVGTWRSPSTPDFFVSV